MDKDNREIYSRHLAVVRLPRLCLDKLPFTNMHYSNTNEIKKNIHFIYRRVSHRVSRIEKKITPHLPFSSKHSSDGCLRPKSDETLFEFRVKTCKKIIKGILYNTIVIH